MNPDAVKEEEKVDQSDPKIVAFKAQMLQRKNTIAKEKEIEANDKEKSFHLPPIK